MPAELAYTDGTADFFEVGVQRSAWHREGHLIPRDRKLTIPEALELIHGDYEVVRRRTFYPVSAAGELAGPWRCVPDREPARRNLLTLKQNVFANLSRHTLDSTDREMWRRTLAGEMGTRQRCG